MISNQELKVLTHAEAIKRANSKILFAKNEKYPGLKSRWINVDMAMGGCWRFKEITCICGASGSGKSYILNMLINDFISGLNKNYPYDYKILSFTLEMPPEDEVIRSISSRVRDSYSNIMSSRKKISDEYYKEIMEVSKKLQSDRLFYVETSGNTDEILDTIDSFYIKNNKPKLVITLDHTLLVDYKNEKSEVDLVANVSKLAMRIKSRYGAMVILLGQLNDKIEQPERRTNPYLNYPTKTDIHGSKSVFMCADSLIIINRPERLGLTTYGPNNFPCENLVAWHFLKSRLDGSEGLLRMRADFENGNLIYPYNGTITK